MMLTEISMIAMVCFGIAAAPQAQADESQAGITLPEMTPAAVQGADYVDPSLVHRKSCTDSPGRPSWVMVQPKGYEWRVELAMAWKALRTRQMLADNGTCTCAALYPDWSEARPEIEAMWESIGALPRAKWSTPMADTYYSTLTDLSRERPDMSVAIGRLCSRPE